LSQAEFLKSRSRFVSNNRDPAQLDEVLQRHRELVESTIDRFNVNCFSGRVVACGRRQYVVCGADSLFALPAK
jgi:hypothetical protein